MNGGGKPRDEKEERMSEKINGEEKEREGEREKENKRRRKEGGR